MKLFTLLTLLLSTSVFAEDLLCTAYTFKGDEVVKSQISIKGKDYQVGKLSSGKVIEELSLNIDGEAISKCIKDNGAEKKPQIFKCVENLVSGTNSKNDSRLSLNKMLVHIHFVQNTSVEIWDLVQIPTKDEFDLSKVASGSIRVFEYGGKFPNIGIYEFKDASGKSLARFYHKVLPTLCK